MNTLTHRNNILLLFSCSVLLYSCNKQDAINFQVQISTELREISNTGSSRGSAYIDSNKIIETERFIYFFWLDLWAAESRIMGITYDKKLDKWLEKILISTSVQDNHGGPAVAIDNLGIIHMFFGSHNGPMNYIYTIESDNISQWSDVEEIGSFLTYPTILIDHENTIYLFARKYYGPYEGLTLQLSKKLGMQPWSIPKDILVPNYKKWIDEDKTLNYSQLGYVRWTQSAAIGNDGKSIHLVFKNYEYLPFDLKTNYQDFKGGAAYFVGYLFSPDGGESWLVDNNPVDLTANPETIEIIAGQNSPQNIGYNYSISNLALDVSGQPTIIVRKESKTETTIFLTKKIGDQWISTQILPESKYSRYSTPIALAINNLDNLFIAETKFPLDNYCDCPDDWGNLLTTTSVIVSKNKGITFETLLSPDFFHEGPIWFANFQNKSYLDNYPNLIMTSGNSKEELKNKVYALRIYNTIIPE